MLRACSVETDFGSSRGTAGTLFSTVLQSCVSKSQASLTVAGGVTSCGLRNAAPGVSNKTRTVQNTRFLELTDQDLVAHISNIRLRRRRNITSCLHGTYAEE
mmetsp:Transcript_86296/g.200659  ORF Transcript_86296/g.200659 Transcript_86296/m.200659 type:complete len:102 (-) Transcript_86296:39-344(-)